MLTFLYITYLWKNVHKYIMRAYIHINMFYGVCRYEIVLPKFSVGIINKVKFEAHHRRAMSFFLIYLPYNG